MPPSERRRSKLLGERTLRNQKPEHCAEYAGGGQNMDVRVECDKIAKTLNKQD